MSSGAPRLILRLALPVTLLGSGTAAAQSRLPVGVALEDYARLMQLTGALPSTSVTVRPSLSVTAQPSTSMEPRSRPILGRPQANPWAAAIFARIPSPYTLMGAQLTLAPLSLDYAWNSARPWGTNDGAIWQGRGHTVALGGGIVLARGRWSAALRPQLIRTGNADFALSPLAGNVGLSPFAYPTGLGQTIDMPQRFGAEPFTTVDWGDSYLRGEFGPVALGLSNENMWWGPGRRNAISMTNNAPGFGHVFLATARPANVGIGTLSARWVWGRLRESRYFDTDATNDSRFMTGIAASFSPRGVPGLELGATRTFLQDWREGGPTLGEALRVLIPLRKKEFVTPSNPLGDDRADQMASLFFRWAMPESRFELYGEWGRGDHSYDFRDLFLEPEHASGFMTGLQKASRGSPSGFWRFAAELTVLGAPRTSTVRAPASAFYVHHLIRQGYTQRGQVMGAGIGPGSSQASVGVHRFARWGRAGARVQRTVVDNNRYYAVTDTHRRHEVEPALTADLLLFVGAWDLGVTATLARLYNQHYIEYNDRDNTNFGLLLRYHPRGRGR